MTGRGKTINPRRAAGALAMIGLVILAACGIPADSEPRAISSDAVPVELQSTTTVGAPPTTALGVERIVYLVVTDSDGDRRLIQRPVVFSGRPEVEVMLRDLLAQRSDFGDTTISNAIPSDLEIISFEQDDDGQSPRGNITLNGPIDVEGQTLQLAVAQLVFTATELGTVDRVRFIYDGAPLSVPDQDGRIRQTVDRSSYADYRPRLPNAIDTVTTTVP